VDHHVDHVDRVDHHVDHVDRGDRDDRVDRVDRDLFGQEDRVDPSSSQLRNQEASVFVFGPVSHMVKTEGLRIGVLGIVVLNNLLVRGEFSKSELVLLFGSVGF